jgi:subtilisin-like proprotein convertase family protein
MRIPSFIAVIAAGVSLSAQAALYTYSFTGINATIPDTDSSGYVNSQTISEGTQGNYLGGNLSVADVVVRLDVSGGWNGDLYAYLRHETVGGTGFAVLLDRVGTTAGNPLGSGLNGFGSDGDRSPFRLTDSASYSDVHGGSSPTYAGQLTGTWQVDQSGGANSLVSFHELNPVGTWSLFVADLSGENVSTLNSWGLEITAVPEPVDVALSVFAAILLVVYVARSPVAQNQIHHWRVAVVQWINAV